MTTKIKLWVGVGTFALLGQAAGGHGPGELTKLLAKPAMAQQHGHDAAKGGEAGEKGEGGEKSQGGEGGEKGQGGEGGEQGEADPLAGVAPEVALATRLLLIRGHLAVGDELVAAGDWNGAMPHFLHPAEELFEDVEEPLEAAGVKGLEEALDALAAAVKAKDAAKFRDARPAVRAGLDAADAALPAETRGRAGHLRDVLVTSLRIAADEYAAAWEDGKLANIVEYQDSRGFVTLATELFEKSRSVLAAADAEATASLAKNLAELRTAWPNVQGPKAPVLEPGEVSAIVSTIEFETGRLR